MITFGYIPQKNIKEHNPNGRQIPNHPLQIWMIAGSGSGKTNALFNLIGHHSDLDKIHLCAKDSYRAKYQLLINICEGVGLNEYNDSKAFIEYWNDMDDIYENIEEYSHDKERKILIVFDDIIADMLLI